MKLLDIITAPWAITPDKLREIKEIYSVHLKGEKIDIKALEAQAGMPFSNDQQELDVVDGVAVIPVNGVLGKKMNMFSNISGGASMQIIESQIMQAINDEAVQAIILNIDSPGGTVDGTAELANKIFSLRGQKPIVSFANGAMASAAVWIGLAADAVFISGETTMTGSVGVIATHVDISKAEQKAGIKTTEIVSGKFKAIFSETKPLSKEGRATIQDQVDFLMSVFVADLAKFKGKTTQKIIDSFGDARTFLGSQAITAGLVDGVSTLDSLIEQLSMSDGVSIIDSIMQNQSIGENKPMSKENEIKPKEITAEYVALENPKVYAQIKQNGFDEGVESIKQKSFEDGAISEQERIKAVEEQSLPGHEDLIASLKFDGKTTGPQAAVKVLNAEKAKAQARIDAIKSDAPAPVESAETPFNEPDINSLQVDERAKAEWDKSAELRAEFSTLAAYTACLKAEESGCAKVLAKS